MVLAPLPEPDSYLTIVLTRPPTAKGHLQTSQNLFPWEFPALHHTQTPQGMLSPAGEGVPDSRLPVSTSEEQDAELDCEGNPAMIRPTL